MTTTVNGVQSISLRAKLKAMRIRPAREPGDKPVFEILLRSEVGPESFLIAMKAGKDMTVHLVPDPDMQPRLPLPEGEPGLSLEDDGKDDDPPESSVSLPSNGRRRRGTQSSELAPAGSA